MRNKANTKIIKTAKGQSPKSCRVKVPVSAGSIIPASILILFLVSYAFPLGDPSAHYCVRLGYDYLAEDGSCRLPDGSLVDSWDLLRGDAGQEYNYCSRNGYNYSVVDDKRCPGMYYGKCVVCVMEDGYEIEVTELMKDRGEYPDLSSVTVAEPVSTTTLGDDKFVVSTTLPVGERENTGGSGQGVEAYLLPVLIFMILGVVYLLWRKLKRS